MRPSKRMRALLWVMDTITTPFYDGPGPHWLTIADQASGRASTETVTLYEFAGRTYVIEGRLSTPAGRWADLARAAGQGTLTTHRTHTGVTLTEVADATLKRQVLALRKDDSPPPERFAAFAVRDPAVFDVTPA
jgi:hypothetical protein